MFNLSDSYINPADVTEIWCGGSNRDEFPYRLIAYFRNGQNYTVDYKYKTGRDSDASSLSAAVDRCRPVVNLDDVEGVLERKIESLRRDMRKMRKEIKESKP